MKIVPFIQLKKKIKLTIRTFTNVFLSFLRSTKGINENFKIFDHEKKIFATLPKKKISIWNFIIYKEKKPFKYEYKVENIYRINKTNC